MLIIFIILSVFYQTRLEYLKNENRHILSLTHNDLQTSQILQWNIAALYETTSWLSDVIKLKATKIVPGERIFKVNLNSTSRLQ